jgi:polyphosphate glucokinase
MSTTDPATPSQSSARPSAAPVAPATAKAVPLTGVALGIDVGGTGIKAAIVDLASAELLTERVRIKTPQPSEPAAVIEVMREVVTQVLAQHPPVDELPIGCGLPGAIKYGHMKTAANLDKGWVDFDATAAISTSLGRPVHVINDADAAGMAELAFGEARDRPGTTILLTIGTGIGSALISEGRLVPNTELGHLFMGGSGKDAETRVSGTSRERRGLGWKRWSREFNAYLAMLEFFFWPDRIIIGGGVSKESKKYWGLLTTNCQLVGARYLNTSGIIGAAYAAGLATHTARAAAAESAAAKASTPGKRAPAARRRPSRTTSAGRDPGSRRRPRPAASAD